MGHAGDLYRAEPHGFFILEQAMNALFNALFGAPDQSHIPTPTVNDDRRFDRAMACIGIAAGIAAAVLSFVL